MPVYISYRSLSSPKNTIYHPSNMIATPTVNQHLQSPVGVEKASLRTVRNSTPRRFGEDIPLNIPPIRINDSPINQRFSHISFSNQKTSDRLCYRFPIRHINIKVCRSWFLQTLCRHCMYRVTETHIEIGFYLQICDPGSGGK